ncbi:MAG: hypothetical protein M3Q11_08920 [Pseudomonadota bacterium]|nr:hypothetical protein [Pseudomonadota bacterium]
MSPRRLLVVIDEMEVGGSQRQIVHLLTGLDRECWQPELVFFRNESFLTRHLHDAGVLVHHVPKRGRLHARFLREFSALLRDGQCDLIHAFSITAEVDGARKAAIGLPHAATGLRAQPAVAPAVLILAAEAFRAVPQGRRDRQFGCRRRDHRTTHGFPRSFLDVIPNGVQVPLPITASERLLTRVQLGVPTGRLFGCSSVVWCRRRTSNAWSRRWRCSSHGRGRGSRSPATGHCARMSRGWPRRTGWRPISACWANARTHDA